MKRVIKMSQAWIAALVIGVALTGCGGGSSGVTDGTDRTSSSGSGSSQASSTGDGTATLSWVAPATRVNGDGIAMGELQGYIIRFGQSASDLSQTITINDASVMDYTVTNLGTGEWFFAVQVVDLDGLTSAPSEVVSKTI
ncbi:MULTISPECIES: fibronectin type III domain-containing protein [Marinobacter]|nr:MULTISPECIES: fibronectin type III domain-containing protein [Marinobacter]